MIDRPGVVIKAEAENVNGTPFGQARMSNGFFHCAETCRREDPVLLRYFLYCTSIELGLKAAILSRDGSERKEKILKKIGHNLVCVYDEFRRAFHDDCILDKSDLDSLKMINEFFYKRGLEYITVDMKLELLRGLKNLPNIESIRTVAKKVNSFLDQNKFFKRG